MTTPSPLVGPVDDTVGPEADVPSGPAPDTRTFDRHLVTAVLVVHDGEPYLAEALDALLGQARPPQRVVAVDTGSTDASRELLARRIGASAVLELPRSTGFAAAVRHAVDAVRAAPGVSTGHPVETQVEWIWLLHDDCAVDAEALRALLAVAEDSPSVGVVGPKVVGWADPGRLLEVGLTIGSGGRRETFVERDELDQGQRDGRQDVLAVGSAGMLVRRDVWDALGGMDERLVLFRDDVDLGWRANLAGHRVVVTTDAVVRHVGATASGRRPADAAGGRRHRADRRSALLVLLANESAVRLPLVYLRLSVASLLRALGLLLVKAPGAAVDELAAASGVLLRPGLLRGARRDRRGQRTVPHRAVRRLLAPPGLGLRHGADAMGGLLAGRAVLSTTAGSAVETGPTSPDLDELGGGGGRLRALLTRPGSVLALALTAVALVSFRGLLLGDGLVQGGALLPAAGGASDLWAQYAAGWHDVGPGSSLAAAPWLVPIAALATVLVGKAWLAVELLLLLAVPLAGLVAYRLLGRLVRSTPLRVLGAVSYALLPAVTGALAAGRLGTAVAAWLLPLTGLAVLRALGSGRGSWPAAFGAGLALAALAAFVPVLWPLVVGAGALVLVLRRPDPAAAGRLLVVAAVPPVLLLPWSLRLVSDPGLLLLEAGAPARSLVAESVPAWQVALGFPGGPGTPAPWLTVGVVLAAAGALLRHDRRRAVLGAWAVALAGLVGALLLSLSRVTPPALGQQVPAWPGPATLVLGAGLVAAAVLGGDGLRARLAGHGFGWRQPLAGAVAVLAVAAPLVLAGAWVVRGASDLLERRGPDVLPPYVVAASATPARPRTLVVSEPQTGPLSYTLVPGEGRRLGAADVAPPADAAGPLGPIVADVLAGRADDRDVAGLAARGVGFLAIPAPVPAETLRAMDGVPGLSRVGVSDGSAVWRLQIPGSRVRIVASGAVDVPVPAEPDAASTTVDTSVAAGPNGRVLVLAETADPGWRATLDGRPLDPSPAPGAAAGWAQAFALPAQGGRLQVGYDSTPRTGWLAVEGALLVLAVVLAVPSRRGQGAG